MVPYDFVLEYSVMTVAETSWTELLTESICGASRLILLGIGNDLRGDDAAGVLCLRELKSRFHGRRDILFIEGGETPENQTGRIREFRPDLVVILDAARGGGTPGKIFLIDKNLIADEDVSTHRVSLAMLIRYLEMSIGTRVVLLGIEPESTDFNHPISFRVRNGISVLVDYFLEIL